MCKNLQWCERAEWMEKLLGRKLILMYLNSGQNSGQNGKSGGAETSEEEKIHRYRRADR